jgi:hypothetical protein
MDNNNESPLDMSIDAKEFEESQEHQDFPNTSEKFSIHAYLSDRTQSEEESKSLSTDPLFPDRVTPISPYENKSISENPLPFYNKTGPLLSILPFYSMDFSNWTELLSNLTTSSKIILDQNTPLITNAFRTTDHACIPSMKKLIEKYIDPRETFDQKLSLYLNCNSNHDNVIDFCKNACSFKHGQIRRLSIIGLFKLTEEELSLLDGFLR